MRYQVGDMLTLEEVFYVYELVDDHGLIFYIGISSNPAQRFRSHANPKHCDRAIIAETIAGCSNPMMRIVSAHGSKKEAENAEIRRVRETPGVLNQKGIERAERPKVPRMPRIVTAQDIERRKEAKRAKSRAKSRKRTTEYYRTRRIRRALRDASKLLNV